MNPQITTNRLLIRPYVLNDFQAWRQAYSQMLSPLNEWDIGPKKPEELTLVDFKKVLKSQKEKRLADSFYDLAVFHRTTGEIIGTVALMDVSRAVFQNAYLGYRVFNPHWKQGYGKEMVQAALKLAFHDLKLHRVEAGIDPKNKRSIFLARSLGLRKEGLKKRALFLNGKWQDIVIYSVTCEDLGVKFRGDLKGMKVRLR